MTDNKVYATARVTVTLEIDASSTWGDDTTNGQMFKQAGEETVQWLRNCIYSRENDEVLRGQHGDATRRIRIVSNPQVTAILTRRTQ